MFILLLLYLADLREVADLYRKRSIRELHAKETQIKQLQSMTIERHPELSGMFLCVYRIGLLSCSVMN